MLVQVFHGIPNVATSKQGKSFVVDGFWRTVRRAEFVIEASLTVEFEDFTHGVAALPQGFQVGFVLERL